jgi:hypothetical protein
MFRQAARSRAYRRTLLVRIAIGRWVRGTQEADSFLGRGRAFKAHRARHYYGSQASSVTR